MSAPTISLIGMYRDTNSGTYVQIRKVFVNPDWYDAAWLDPTGKLHHERLSRNELERMLRAGLMTRDYRRNS